MFQLLIAAFMDAMHGLKTGESVQLGTRFVPSADEIGKARQTQTIITGLVIVIVASLAVIVVDRFDQSLGTPDSSALSTSQNDILAGFADMTSLIGPLLLVLIAVVIIGVVQRIRA
jgi:hypothetical protein